MIRQAARLLVSLAGVAIVTLLAYRATPVNATTAGFAYLLLVLVIASAWGFVLAASAAVAATLTYNIFFFPPIGTFNIYDAHNWVALFSFLTTALLASRLSAKAKSRALEAIARQQDLERLYTFSRAILLIDSSRPFAREMIQKLAEIFELKAAVLFDRHTEEIYRAGPSEFEGLDEQLREAAFHGASFSDPERQRLITGIRLGADPIASLALQGATMPDSVLQGIANLLAIGLERARAQDLARQVEVARDTEQLRTTIIDAMAHEFKTPLTSIKAATTSLLASPEQPPASRIELAKIADEEADHLNRLIEDTLYMARLDSGQIHVHSEIQDVPQMLEDVVASMRSQIEDRKVEVFVDGAMPPAPLDRKLIMLAIKQVLDNALKYSPVRAPVTIRAGRRDGSVDIEITDRGDGIAPAEQRRIFDRFYRSPAVKHQAAGTGLGLNIAASIVAAHNGSLTVSSKPGETTFRFLLPLNGEGDRN